MYTYVFTYAYSSSLGPAIALLALVLLCCREFKTHRGIAAIQCDIQTSKNVWERIFDEEDSAVSVREIEKEFSLVLQMLYVDVHKYVLNTHL